MANSTRRVSRVRELLSGLSIVAVILGLSTASAHAAGCTVTNVVAAPGSDAIAANPVVKRGPSPITQTACSGGTSYGGVNTSGTNPGATPGIQTNYVATVLGVNTYTGNKATSVPLTGWGVRGGRLGVNFTLYNNSLGTDSFSQLGSNWKDSYTQFYISDAGSTTTLYLPNGGIVQFSFANGVYTAPAGVQGTLTKLSSGGFQYVSSDQTIYKLAATDNGLTVDTYYLSEIGDELGNRIYINRRVISNTLGVYPYSQPTTIQDCNVYNVPCRTLTYNYLPDGRLDSIQDSNNRKWTFSIIRYGTSTSYSLNSITFPSVNSASPSMVFQYAMFPARNGLPSSLLISALTDLNGKTSRYYFESTSRRFSRYASPLNVNSSGNATMAGSQGSSYGLTYTPITTTDPNTGVVTVIGGTTTITNTNGKQVKYVYDANGFNTQVIDQLGKTTRYSYDTDKNSTSVQTPLGFTAQYFYDTRGNLTQVKSPVDSSCGNASCTVNLSYNNKNHVVQITSPSGIKSRIAYDNSTSRVLQTQVEIDTAFLTSGPDGNGNYPTLSSGDGRIAYTYAYAFNGYPPSARSDANGNTYTYDYDGYGNLKRYTTASGKNRLYTYNALNTLLSRTDPDGSTYTFTPDNWQRTLQVTAVGNFSGATSAQTLNYSFAYDNNSNLTDVYPPLITYQPGEFAHHYTYDADNRLTNDDVDVQTSASATPVRKKEYEAIYDQNPGCDGTDLRGLLTGSYNYFPYDVNRSETPNTANGPNNTVYCYNDRSTLSSFVTSTSGRFSYYYDDDGKLKQINYPNPNQPPNNGSNYNLYQYFLYDNVGRKVGREYHRLDGAFVANFTLSYNSDGQVTSHGRDLRPITNQGMNSSYNYFRRGWLKQSNDSRYSTTANLGTYTHNFDYDLGGRRRSRSNSSPSENYTFTYNIDDQITQLTETVSGYCENRAYTDNGNLSQTQDCSNNPKIKFEWGAFDRLTRYYSVNDPFTSGTYDYQFFPDASLTTRGYKYLGITQYGSDPHQLFLTKNGGQSTGQTNTDAAGINSTNATSITYNVGQGTETTDSLPIYDLFGDRMRASISSTGAVLKTGYTSFSSVDGTALGGASYFNGKSAAYQSSTQPAVNTWRGEYGYFDPRTTYTGIPQLGNYYYQLGKRWYDPVIGQFISRDSDISQPAYQYAYNDPVNFVDPTGNAPSVCSLATGFLFGLSVGAFAVAGLAASPLTVTAIGAVSAFGVAFIGTTLSAPQFSEGYCDFFAVKPPKDEQKVGGGSGKIPNKGFFFSGNPNGYGGFETRVPFRIITTTFDREGNILNTNVRGGDRIFFNVGLDCSFPGSTPGCSGFIK